MFLDVGDGHILYYEIHGTGKPAVVLHGGPGGGLDHAHLNYFDLTKWCVVLFDQRGCGKSTGPLQTNTTWHLVRDIEQLRQHLHFPTWLVLGGSWGTTLALAYAQTHPSAVSALILRGVFLGRQCEMDWLYERGASDIFPEEWERFTKPIRSMKQTNNTLRYKALLANRRTRKSAAKAWWGWEASVSFLKPRDNTTPDAKTLDIATLENHYFSNNSWLKPGQLLKGAKRLRIPTTIVQGRYDLVCPMRTAWTLKQTMGSYAKLVVVPDAGHAGSEPGTVREMKKAVADHL